jgi:hypothetical protein
MLRQVLLPTSLARSCDDSAKHEKVPASLFCVFCDIGAICVVFLQQTPSWLMAGLAA